MDYIDHKFLMTISMYLDGFSQVKSGLYKCRCPLCGDSKVSKTKKRGYFFSKSDSLIFKCHNCSASMSFYNFLGIFNPDIQHQYKIEKFKSKSSFNFEDTKPQKEPESVDLNVLAQKIFDLPLNHHARAYIEKRQIPKIHARNLYYIDDIRKITSRLEEHKDKFKSKIDAIIIPFYDEVSELTFIQFRFFSDSFRYMTIQIKEGKKIWGLDLVDFSRPVYVTEGPFDAMFVDNAIACAGVSILSESKYLLEACSEGFTIIFDNDYRENFEVYKLLKKAVDDGLSVVFFDKYFPGKDVNDAILAGMTQEELMDYLRTHTKTNLGARLALSEIKPPK